MAQQWGPVASAPVAAAVESNRGRNPLTRKLSHFVRLSAADHEILDVLTQREERHPADVDIIREGQQPRSAFLLKEGLAVRYRSMPDGGRQIMTFLIPGDFCDVHVFMLKAMDHSIGTITPVKVAPIPRDSIMELFSDRPRISAALWWSSLQEEAMLRERIVSLGRRDARGRIAYLLCELLWRYAAVGMTSVDDELKLPLTQTELGDTVGLTPVHVNRVLKDFRERRLISIEHGTLRIHDVDRLQDIAGFTKDYLNLEGASEEMARYFDQLEARQRVGDGNALNTAGPQA